MSQNIQGVNNYTNVSGSRNTIEDYSVPFRKIFSNEGVLEGLIVKPTDPTLPAIQITAGYAVIDCGNKGFLVFRLKEDITQLEVPNTGAAKYYLVVLKVDITNATAEFQVKEGTVGQDPALTEGGTPEVYYLTIARIQKGATINVETSEIVQDSASETNNATPEVIYRTSTILGTDTTLPLDYWGLDALETVHDEDHFGQYRNPSTKQIEALWRTTTLAWNGRIETPTTYARSQYLTNPRMQPRDASGNVGAGSWLTTPLNILGMPVDRSHLYRSSTLDESVDMQVVGEEVTLQVIKDPTFGEADIYWNGVLEGTYDWAGTPTVRQIATFEVGDFSGFTNATADTVDFSQGSRSYKQTQGADGLLLAVGTFTTPKDLSASQDSDVLYFWGKVTNAANVTYVQMQIRSTDLVAGNFVTVQFSNVKEGVNLFMIRRSQLLVGAGTMDWSNITQIAFRARTNAGGGATISVDDLKFIVPSNIFTKTGIDPLVFNNELTVKVKGTGEVNIVAISMNASKRALETHNTKRGNGALGEAVIGIIKDMPDYIEYSKADLDLLCDLQLEDWGGTNRALEEDGVGSIEVGYYLPNDKIEPGRRIVTDNGFTGINFILAYLMLKAAKKLTVAEETKYLGFINKQMTYLINYPIGYNYWNVANSNFQFGFLGQLAHIATGNIAYKTFADGVMDTTFIEGNEKFHMVKGKFAQLFLDKSIDDDDFIDDVAIYFDEHDEFTTLNGSISEGATQLVLTSYTAILFDTSTTGKWVALQRTDNSVQIIRLGARVSGNTWAITETLFGEPVEAFANGTKILRTFDVGYSWVQLIMAVGYGYLSDNIFWTRVGKALYNTLKPLTNNATGMWNNTGGSRQNTTDEILQFGLGGLLMLSNIDRKYYPNKVLLQNAQNLMEYNLETVGTMNVPDVGSEEFERGDAGRTSTFTWAVAAAMKFLFGLDGIERGAMKRLNPNDIKTTLESLSVTSPMTYDAQTGEISLPAATGSQNGYLTSTDWTTFNNKLDKAGGTMSGVINMGTHKITNLGDPTDAQDAATKTYVDALAQGLAPKESVRAATTANITLSGAQTIDGVSVIAGDRVLVKDQSTGSQNGIYVAASGAWARSTDADSSADILSSFTFVEEGTVNGDSGWVLTTNAPTTLGSTTLTFVQFTSLGQITAGDGLTKTGSTLNVNPDNTTIEISSDQVIVKAGGIGNTQLANDRILSVQSGSATFTYSTDTKQTLFTFNLPASSLAADGDMVSIEAMFMIDNQSGSNQTFTLGCDLGSTNLVTATTGTGLSGNISNAANYSVVKVTGTIRRTGNNTQRGVFHFDIAGRSLSYDFHGTAAEDDDTILAVTLHITMTTSNANYGFNKESFIARLLKAV